MIIITEDKGRIKKDNSSHIELKQFYSTSKTYLKRLKKHDERYFAPYVKLCKELIQNGSLILDCGCGIGLSSYLLTKSGLDVTGIDISPLFISEAKKKYSNQENLIFLVEDASKMSFRDNTFDAVCCFDLLEHVINVNDVIKEICRVLKKGRPIIIFMPNHLTPLQHLIGCFRWRKKDIYKPWEANNRIAAFYQFIRTAYLTIVKAIGINNKIYYLRPILSNRKDFCGDDFDATWLTNWFDIENILKELSFFIRSILPQNSKSKILRIIKFFGLPKTLQSFYLKTEAPCIIVGMKR